MLLAAFDAASPLALTLASGQVVNFAMVGEGAGDATEEDGNVRLSITGTSSATSVSATSSASWRLGAVDTSSLGALSAPGADLAGSLSSSGPLGALRLGNVNPAGAAGLTLQIAGDAGSFEFGRVGPVAIDVAGRLGFFRAIDVVGGSFEADRVGTLALVGDKARQLRGDWGSAVRITGVGLAPGELALGTLKVPGDLTRNVIVAGPVGRVSVGRLDRADVFSGFAPTVTGAPLAGGTFASAGSEVREAFAWGVDGSSRAAVVDGVVAADRVGTARIGGVGRGARYHGIFANTVAQAFIGPGFQFDQANPGRQPGGMFQVVTPAAQSASLTIAEAPAEFAREAVVPIELGGTTNGRRVVTFSVRGFSERTLGEGDRLLVYLVDPSDATRTLLDRGESGTALLTLTRDQIEVRSGLVQFDGSRATVDVTGALAGAARGLLLFQLIGSGAIDSSVVVSQITNSVEIDEVPATPASLGDAAQGVLAGTADLTRFELASEADVIVRNARYVNSTGRFEAEVAVQNRGGKSPRSMLVGFQNLPAGVTLADAAAIASDGTQYVNLSDSISSGGLGTNTTSGFTLVRFDNPQSARIALRPVVRVGPDNTAPMLQPIGVLSVSPGGYLDVATLATDADGDRLTFQVVARDSLPSGRVNADGGMVFTPSPEQLGSYQFALVVSDGIVSVRRDLRLDVVPDADTRTRISGQVLDVDGTALVGVPMEMGTGANLQRTLTDAQGRFTLVLPAGFLATDDTLRVEAQQLQIAGRVYPFVAEKLPLMFGFSPYEGYNNVIGRPIYLPQIDVASGSTINPAQDTMVTNASLNSSVMVRAGTVNDPTGAPFTGVMSISAVPNEFTPAALPPDLIPDLVVTIQPAEMRFTTPAPLTLPNLSGFAPGTLMDLWSINPVTGVFDDVGDARVSADGSVVETISGGIRNSSWHFVTPPQPDPENPTNNDQNKDESCTSNCQCESMNSRVDSHAGYLSETHDLVSFSSQGVQRALSLRYDTFRADPRPIVSTGFTNIPANSANVLAANMTIRRGSFTQEVAGADGSLYGLTGQMNFFKLPRAGGSIRASIQADMRSQPTGRYEYTIMSGPMQRSQNAQNETRLTGRMASSSSSFIVVNELNSPFGAGWNLGGLQSLFENPDGSMLLVDGGGQQLLFTRNPNGSYTSPSGDFSVLSRDGAGVFTRSFTDGTIATFDADRRLVQVRDSVGNVTRHNYDSQGRITEIIDPVGLSTLFAYGVNGKVASITDPAGRVTQLQHDASGNLTRIVDPDGSSRSFGYDASNRMVSELDKRGRTETVEYDFAGRVQRATRSDGSTSSIRPPQVVGLFRPSETRDLDNAPVALVRGPVTSTFIDANGRQTTKVLDKRGQLVSGRDGGGALPTYTRDASNQVTRMVDPRGFTSNMTYDTRGNLLTSVDPVDRVEYQYDPTFSRVTRMTDELGRVTQYEIDPANGNVLSITAPDSSVTRFTYNQAGQVLTTTDALGRITEFEYNAQGRMIRTTAAAGSSDAGTRRYEYDAAGNQTAMIDENGNRTVFQYDALNRLVRTTDALGQTTTMVYNAAGDLLSTTDARGNTTTNTYDARGRLATSTAPDTGVTTYGYDQNGNLASVVDPVGQRTEYEYDERNRLRRTVDARGGITSYRYDTSDNLIRVTDPVGNATAFFYDSRSRLVSEVQVDSGSSGPQVINVDLTQWQRVNHRGGTPTRWQVSGSTNQVVQTLDNNSSPGFFISNEPLVNAQVSIRGAVVDAGGDDDFIGFVFGMDLTANNEPNNYYVLHWKRAAQSLLGGVGEEGIKLLKVSNAGAVSDSSMASQLWNGENSANIQVLETALGFDRGWDEGTFYIFNLVYRSSGTFNIEIRRADNNTLVQRINFTDNQPLPGDRFGFYSQSQSGTEYTPTFTRSDGKSYLYDESDNLVAMIDRNGRRTQYTYDSRDRLVREEWLPEQGSSGQFYTIDYTYDAVGNLLSAFDPSSRLVMAYDARNRLRSTDNTGTPSVPAVVMSYDYDAVGNVAAVRDTIRGQLTGLTQSSFDALNRLTRITQGPAGVGAAVREKRADFAYNPLGQFTGITRFADLAGTQTVANTTMAYDTLNRVTQISHTRAGAAIASFGYTYDRASRITRIADAQGTIDYSYDTTNQLTGAQYSDASRTDETYTYDLNGNRIASQRSAAHTTGVHNRLTEDDSFRYEYDREGNLTKRTTKADNATREFAWDYRNRLTLITDKDGAGVTLQTVAFSYDSSGRRILKVETDYAAGVAGTPVATSFVYDREDIALRFRDADGLATGADPVLEQRILHGLGIDMPLMVETTADNTTRSLLTDHLGSVRAEVTEAGAVALQNYDAFGAVSGPGAATGGPNSATSNLVTDYGFTGRELDRETGLMYYRARYYDVGSGRFVSEDPLGLVAGSLVLYSYAQQSPLLFRDPMGEQSMPAFDDLWNNLPVVQPGGVAQYFKDLGFWKPEDLAKDPNGEETNTCAIRFSDAMNKSGSPIPRSRTTWRGKESTRFEPGAQRLADQLAQNWGSPQVFTDLKKAEKALQGKKGTIFFKDGWGTTDHIDAWNGTRTKGTNGFGSSATEVWFWNMR